MNGLSFVEISWGFRMHSLKLRGLKCHIQNVLRHWVIKVQVLWQNEGKMICAWLLSAAILCLSLRKQNSNRRL